MSLDSPTEDEVSGASTITDAPARHFELIDGKSSKFWEAELDGTVFSTRYGKIGTNGQNTIKELSSPDAARKEYEKAIAEKVKKGYMERQISLRLVGSDLPHQPKGAGGGPMDDNRFWSTIALFNWKKAGDDEAVLRPAQKVLAAMTPRDICTFEDLLTEKLYALDTREHCRHCYAGSLDPDNGDDYISADDFLYNRCAVVANGREFYEEVLRDPSKFPHGLEFEALLSLASEAYEEKTGDEYEHSPPLSYESFSNKEGWRPTQNTRQGKFTAESIPPGNRRPT